MDSISADFPFTKRKVKVLGSEMAYVEAGESAGVTVVFCTATRPRRTCGGTSSRTWPPRPGASRPT